MDKVTEQVEKYRSRVREQVEQKENSLDMLADEMANLILDQNREYLGNDVVDSILNENKTEEGGKVEDEKKQKKTRGRKKTKQSA